MIYGMRELITEIKVVADRYDILEIRLFGSYFDGDPTEDSDVDLIVTYGEGCRGLDCIRFMLDLEENLGKEVDVLNVEFLPGFLSGGDLTTKSKLIYEQENFCEEREEGP